MRDRAGDFLLSARAVGYGAPAGAPLSEVAPAAFRALADERALWAAAARRARMRSAFG
jgi:hypothetical protein